MVSNISASINPVIFSKQGNEGSHNSRTVAGSSYADTLANLLALGSSNASIMKTMLQSMTSGQVSRVTLPDTPAPIQYHALKPCAISDVIPNQHHFAETVALLQDSYPQIIEQLTELWGGLSFEEVPLDIQNAASEFFHAGLDMAQESLLFTQELKLTFQGVLQSLAQLDPESLSQLAAQMGLANTAFTKKIKELEDRFQVLMNKTLVADVATVQSADSTSSSSSSNKTYANSYLTSGSPLLIYLGLSLIFTDLSSGSMSALANYYQALSDVQAMMTNYESLVNWATQYLNGIVNYQLTVNQDSSGASWPSTSNNTDYDSANGTYPAYTSGTYNSASSYYDKNNSTAYTNPNTSTSVNYIWLSVAGNTASGNSLAENFSETVANGSETMYFVSPQQFSNITQYMSACLAGFDGGSDTDFYTDWGYALTQNTYIVSLQSSLSNIGTTLSSDASATLSSFDTIQSGQQSLSSAVFSNMNLYFSLFGKMFNY